MEDNRIQTGEAVGLKEKSKPHKPYGKFNDAESLYKAYCALEAEFTKRCQELKAVTEAAASCEKETAALRQKLSVILEDENVLEAASLNEEVKKAVIKNYLISKNGYSGGIPPLLTRGLGFAAPSPKKPASLEEAGLEAQKLFKRI